MGGAASSSRSTSVSTSSDGTLHECGLCESSRSASTAAGPAIGKAAPPATPSSSSTAPSIRRTASTATVTSTSTASPSSSLPPRHRHRHVHSSAYSHQPAQSAQTPSNLIRPVRIVPPKLNTPNSVIYKQRRQQAAPKRGRAKAFTATEREQEPAKLY